MEQGHLAAPGAAPPADATRRRGRLRRRKPANLAEMPDGSWGRIARRTFDNFRSDGGTNLAAALTFRSLLAVFPALVAMVALLGVLGQYPQTFNAVLQIVGRLAPASTVHAVSTPLRAVINDKGGAGALLGAGLIVTVWAASGYVGAFSWATNVMWEAKRGRSWYRQWPFDIAVTFVALLVATLIVLAVVLTGPVARSVGQQLGIGSDALTVWDIAKWPVLIVLVTAMINALYYVAPNVRTPRAHWLTPGAILAVIVWALTSLAFALYVANFDSYNRTYGTLGAIVTFLVWLWLTNIALLLGVELNSEIERERQLAAGSPGADTQIQLPLRQR